MLSDSSFLTARDGDISRDTDTILSNLGASLVEDGDADDLRSPITSTRTKMLLLSK